MSGRRGTTAIRCASSGDLAERRTAASLSSRLRAGALRLGGGGAAPKGLAALSPGIFGEEEGLSGGMGWGGGPGVAEVVTSAMRLVRVSGVFAVLIHSSVPRFTLRGVTSQNGRWPAASRAASRSSGAIRASTSFRKSHWPLALAAAIFASPAGVMAPEARARSTWALLIADHADLGLRGAIRIIERSASSARVTGCRSSPMQRSSSTMAS